MLGRKPTKSHMEQQLKLSKGSGELLKDAGKFRRLIGKLMYLTLSRPNINYVVHRLSQFRSLFIPKDLHVLHNKPILLYSDNQVAFI